MKNKHKFVRVGFTNCYLLECSYGYLLIDTEYPHHYEKFGLIFNNWQKYIEFDGKFLYPAHGKPFNIKYLIKSLKKLGNL